jgi:signal transduction histidine kinase
MHETTSHFDAEDARVLGSLAKFASAGYQSLKATQALEAYGAGRANEVQRLSEANRSKDEFIATIAHELRNPLAPIRTSAALLLRGLSDAETVLRTAEIIDRQSKSMVRLIDDLLDVSRARLGSLELNPTRVNLTEILRPIVEGARSSEQAKLHEVELKLPNEPVLVEGDPLRLTQVFGNLLNNAVKYTDDRGRIAVGLARSGTNALVDITDSGIGIAPEQIESIFDLFAQAGQEGSARSRGGLGIGLHLAKQLVEAHGGLLKATSAGPGCGSTFTVQLPCVLP